MCPRCHLRTRRSVQTVQLSEQRLHCWRQRLERAIAVRVQHVTTDWENNLGVQNRRAGRMFLESPIGVPAAAEHTRLLVVALVHDDLSTILLRAPGPPERVTAIGLRRPRVAFVLRLKDCALVKCA